MAARNDCGYGLAGGSIAVPILANDDDPSSLPAALQVALPDPEVAQQLWFSQDGVLNYDGTGDEAQFSVHYRDLTGSGADDPGGEVFFLFPHGDQPPEIDPRVAAACSQTSPDRIIAAAPEVPVDGACGSGVEIPAAASGYRLRVDVEQLQGSSIELDNEAFATPSSRYVAVEGGVLIFQQTGGVVFLAGADRTDLDVSYSHPGDFGPACSSPGTFIDFFVQPPAAGAFAEANRPEITRLVHLNPPAGSSAWPAVDEQSAPFCADEQACIVLRPQDSQDAVIADAHPAFAASQAGLWPGSALLQLAAFSPEVGGANAGAALAGALLADAPDSHAVIVRGFFEDDAARLSIGGSYFVPAGELMRFAQNVEVAGLPAQLIAANAFPPRSQGTGLEHGGGAGFRPLDSGGLEGGLVPLLGQPPTDSIPRHGGTTDTPPPPPAGNREPVANDDLAATFNDQPLRLDPLINDFDPDPRDVISLAGVRGLVETPAAAILSAQALAGAGGSARIVNGHTILYTPDPTFAGTATIRYVIADDHGGRSAPATISVAVVDRVGPPGNQPPVARDDDAQTPIDRPVTIDVLANDFDQDGLPNDLLPPGAGIPLTIERIVERPEHGTLERVGTGGDQQLRYTPEPGFAGADRFSYTVSDGLDPSEPGVVRVQVGPAPPPPEAVDDAALAQVGGAAIAIDVLANDLGSGLAIVALGAAQFGTAVIDGERVVYQAPDDLSGAGRIVDQFSYAIGDGTESALVRVDLNRAPEAGDDLVRLEGRTTMIDVLGNDGDPDGDALAIVALGAPQQPGAEVAISDDGRQILYTRPAGGDGSDSFDYTIDDGRGGSASATVRLFEGPGVPPTLTVEPTTVSLPVAADFDFPTATPFPALSEGRMLDQALVHGVEAGDLTLDVSRTVALSFVSEQAGFDNSLGVYTLAGGVPSAPELIFARLDAGELAGGEQVLLGRFPADAELGLFLVQDGADLLTGAPELAFRPDADGNPTLVRIDGGVERPVDATVFFSDSSLNGGTVQAIAGRTDDGSDDLRIGFEDRAVHGGADGDYDDAVVEIHYGHVSGTGLDLAATIDDPDSATMLRATATIASGAAGDRLLLDGADLPGGVAVTGEGTGALTFSGAASAADYEQLLGAVELEVDVLGGPRELVFQVFDDSSPAAQPSNQASVTVDPVPLGAAGVDSGAMLAGLLVPDQVAA